MKKIYLILLLAPFSTNLFSQQDSLTVLDSTIAYYWDSDATDWKRYDRVVYVYDAFGNRIEYSRYLWDSNTNEWDYYRKEESYWSQLTTSISNDIVKLKFLVYPNPTKGILNLETGITGQYFIEIASLNGQKLFSDRNEGPIH